MSKRKSNSASPVSRAESPPATTPRRWFQPRLPWLSVPIVFAVGFIMAYVLLNNEATIGHKQFGVQPVMNTDGDWGVSFNQLSGKKFVKPLLMVEINHESEGLQDVKQKLNDCIAGHKKNGALLSASVYLLKLHNGEWIGIEQEQPYLVASMLKLPILMNYLKMAEENPALLQTQIVNDVKSDAVPNQTFGGVALQPGKAYTVRELLEAMIVKSDNVATALLKRGLTPEQYNRVYAELGFAQHALNYMTYGMAASEFSRFFRTLFNASYLNVASSEYALQLLSQSQFVKGLAAGLPQDVLLAHKFGEKGTGDGKTLSESGIVYLDNNPYLITVFTKGPVIGPLPGIVAELSSIAFQSLSGRTM